MTWRVAILGVCLVLLTSSAAGAASNCVRKNTSGPVGALAMDGARVAYDIPGVWPRCNRVYVWNVLTGTTTRVSGPQTCRADTTSTGAGVRELAVAGRRVAWIVNQGGNSESDDYLYTSSLPKPKERKLASAVRTGDVPGVPLTCGGNHGGGLAGKWIGCLVGAKAVLAVNRWSTDGNDNVTSASLQTIGARLKTIASGQDVMDAVSTDGRQIAVLRTTGDVALYSTAGKLLRVVTPSSAKEVALRGDYLAVLTKAGKLEVYNSHSGKLLHRWHVAKGASHLDVSSKLAAYAATRPGGSKLRVVHVLSLPTGKDRAVAITSTRQRVVGVQLEPTGLVYAVDGTTTGRLVFMPMRCLPR